MAYIEKNFEQNKREEADSMEENSVKGNVLVIGNSGVGKSTLINAVLGVDVAEAGSGSEGVTKQLEVYENDVLPFRIIDTVGFEPSFWHRHSAIHATKKWSKDSVKEGNDDTQINLIWFCVDGTSRKLFRQTIDSLSKATAMWPSVPVVVVITKSYSVPERQENEAMVENVFSTQKTRKNLKGILPVVASTYVLNESAYSAPDGITELIDKTNELLPEGFQATERDISSFKLNRKRFFAQSVVAVATTSGVVVGAVPIPFADAAILVPAEVAEIKALAKVYGIESNDDSKEFFNKIVEVGTVSVVAKTAISALKAIPGVNLGAAALNAVMAGGIMAALGEGSIYAFEQIYLGNKTVDDLDWVTKIMESKLSNGFVEKISAALSSIDGKMTAQKISEVVSSLFVAQKESKH
jgi:uncharacterized protein (DUF697 family)/GTP-binding protein EngB required for normal cell division